MIAKKKLTTLNHEPLRAGASSAAFFCDVEITNLPTVICYLIVSFLRSQGKTDVVLA